ncbi:hypothetical protein NERG_01070 [Nematocida ausubeli]|uniref:Uncharacterized protein n=1 Tax=Nematocida ausubeli (strain ATCC PRA-371 / ERTm2) TaxID=1913371 RepID=H8ZCS3_NEMA1|nr:hypothetical protein NERG_01070 [Nematocida ausubeli]
MIITAYTVLILSLYLGAAHAEVCYDRRSNILQGKTDEIYLDSANFRNWPRDENGVQNIDNTCPIGFTCLANRDTKPSKKRKNKKARKPRRRPVKNIKFKSRRFKRDDFIDKGCLGLEKYEEVGLQSALNNLYMGACKQCIGNDAAKYKTLAMVYTTFNNDEAKWKFIALNGKCTIKNVHTGMYMSKCDNCAPMALNTPMVALFREEIDDNTNDEVWTVTRKVDGDYVFQSASNGGYLGICKDCLSEKTTMNMPAATLDTVHDSPSVAWSVRIDEETESYA